MYEKAEKVFRDAEMLMRGDRQDIYGNSTETARKVGMVWAAVLGLGEPIPPYLVHTMMAGFKLVRGSQEPEHEDSWVDGAAYIGLAVEAIDL